MGSRARYGLYVDRRGKRVAYDPLAPGKPRVITEHLRGSFGYCRWLASQAVDPDEDELLESLEEPASMR